MKGATVKLFTFVTFCLMSVFILNCDSNFTGDNSAKLETVQDSVSYSIGANYAGQLLTAKEEINLDKIIYGMQDKFNEEPLLLTTEESQKVMRDFSMRMRKKQEDKNKVSSQSNIEEGNNFLAENKNKDGVVTTATGLQYKVIAQGNGSKPVPTDKVSVHYRGTLIDGTEFDSSYKRGKPVSFPVNGVIKGWTEALQLMNVGSKYQLFIPSNLAYGKRGAGQTIGPDAVLIFEVELLGIEK